MRKLFSCRVNWSALSAACLIWVAGEAAAIASFDPPPGQGMPTSTAGGGTRPAHLSCSQPETRAVGLTALSPSRYVGLTTQEHPAVWVYLPTTTATTVELSLFDQNGNGIYQTTLPITGSGKLVRLPFPDSAPTLSTTEPYYWTVAIVCDQNHRTDDWVVGGWIRQRALDKDLQRQLSAASAEQRVRLYAQSGFWYDAIDVLAKLHGNKSHNINLDSTWDELMQSIGLYQLAQGPLELNLK